MQMKGGEDRSSFKVAGSANRECAILGSDGVNDRYWTSSPEMFLFISQKGFNNSSQISKNKKNTFTKKRANSKVRSKIKMEYGEYFNPSGNRNRQICRENSILKQSSKTSRMTNKI